MKEKIKEIIWDKTAGRCHFCGGRLIFGNYGKNKSKKGNWNIDHVFPRAKHGTNQLANRLPICGICNGLKWHYTGKKIQELMQYGFISLSKKRKNSPIGKEISRLLKVRQMNNKRRRNKN